MSADQKFTRNDRKLLHDAIRSSGGGVNVDFYPESVTQRLLKRGLIQWKPNQEKSKHHALLLTITPSGKAAFDKENEE